MTRFSNLILISLFLIIGYSFFDQQQSEAGTTPRVAAHYNEATNAPQSGLDTTAAIMKYTLAGTDDDHIYMDGLPDSVKQWEGYFIYNSLTDDDGPDTIWDPADTTGGGEYNWYLANYAAYGAASVEEAYLHWNEETFARPNTYFHVFPAGSKVHVYSDVSDSVLPNARRARVMPSFHTEAAFNMRLDYAMYQLYQTGTIKPVGIFWDNVGLENIEPKIYFYITHPNGDQEYVGYGGAVAEHPTNAHIQSTEFRAWYYRGNGSPNYNVQVFLDSLASRIEGTKLQATNLGKVYPGSAFTSSVTGTNELNVDFYFFEFTPARLQFGGDIAYINSWYTYLNNLYTTTNKKFWFSPNGRKATTAQTARELYDAWAFHMAYVPAIDSTRFHIQPNQFRNDPLDGVTYSQWLYQQNQPIHTFDVGDPISPPSLKQSGTDPLGSQYRIYEREFTNVKVLSRIFYPTAITDYVGSAVTVDLGNEYYIVDWATGEADTSSTVSSVSLGQGQGYFLQPTGPTGPFELIQAPAIADTVTNFPMPIPSALGAGPYAVVDNNTGEELPVNDNWFLAPELYTGKRFRVYQQAPNVTSNVFPADWTGVYHYEDDPTVGIVSDSGQSGNDRTAYSGDPDLSRQGFLTDTRVDGVIGQGWYIDATDSTAIRTVDKLYSSDGTFSFAAWCSLTTTSTDFLFQSQPSFWQFAVQASNVSPYIQFKDAGRPGADPEIDVRWVQAGIPKNEWVHVAATFDSAESSVRVYVNGTEQSVFGFQPSGADTSTVWDGHAIGGTSGGINETGIGFPGSITWNSLDGGLTPADPYDGGFDEAFIVDRKLSDSEVAIMAGSQADPNVWWVFAGSDIIAPTFNSISFVSDTVVELRFSETVDPTTATNTANYSISPSHTISTAIVSNSSNVRLTLGSSLIDQQEYTVTVNNVEDVNGNVIAANSQRSSTYYDPAADAPSLTSATVFVDYTAVFRFDRNVEFAASGAGFEVYIWDGDSYLDNPISIGTGGAIYSDEVRFFKASAFPNDTWFVFTVEGSSVRGAGGGSIQTLFQRVVYQKGTPAVPGPDFDAPTISGIQFQNSTTLDIIFSEVVDSTSAVNPNNYLIWKQ